MLKQRTEIGEKRNWIRNKSIRVFRVIFLILFSFSGKSLLVAQIISNQSAYVSVTPGTVIGADSITNGSSASLSNDGTLNLYSIINGGGISGNGTYNILQRFINAGTFSSGTSTVNYNSPGAQTIATVNYYTLNIASTSPRVITLPSSGTIGIANTISLNSGTNTYVANGSTLNFNGTSSQSIPVFPFYNLQVDNASGATLSGASTLAAVLKVNGQFNSNGNLTLLSTADQTALIDGSGTGDVLGNVTIQRYLASGFGYKYFSSPFQSATVNEFSDEVNLLASFPTFYSYDEDLLSHGWINYTNTSGLLDPLHGYAANFGTSSSALTADMSGVVSNHTISATLYNHNQPYTQGFNLVGNPYPSPIDWDVGVGWTRTNIDDAIYYFNASDTNQYTGIYSSYINGISSDGIANNIVPAMQGFFVHVSDGSYPVAGTLNVNNAARVNNLVPNFHKPEGDTRPVLRLNAHFSDVSNSTDATAIYFDDNTTNDFEKEADALKLMNTDANTPSIYSFSNDGHKLSINGMPPVIDSTTVVPLGLQSKMDGEIIFEATKLDWMPMGERIYLADASTGKAQELHPFSQYSFQINEGTYENRFSLIFSKSEVNASGARQELNAYAYGKKLFVYVYSNAAELLISNVLGQTMLRKQLNGAGYHEIDTKLSSAVYVITLLTDNSKNSKTILIGDE